MGFVFNLVAIAQCTFSPETVVGCCENFLRMHSGQRYRVSASRAFKISVYGYADACWVTPPVTDVAMDEFSSFPCLADRITFFLFRFELFFVAFVLLQESRMEVLELALLASMSLSVILTSLDGLY